MRVGDRTAQQSKPQATNLMVQSFAGVLVFVVISTPVELYSRVQLGRDVADVDPLHFGVQVSERGGALLSPAFAPALPPLNLNPNRPPSALNMRYQQLSPHGSILVCS